MYDVSTITPPPWLSHAAENTVNSDRMTFPTTTGDFAFRAINAAFGSEINIHIGGAEAAVGFSEFVPYFSPPSESLTRYYIATSVPVVGLEDQLIGEYITSDDAIWEPLGEIADWPIADD